ncbi:MAG: oxidoreductase [Planctomycetaceae bacterium]|nr:MAG: oxidoreductase [Planctomycetaceae bacterium]
MNQGVCRWGILGTANIGRKNWAAIQRSGNSMVTAVASRELSKSQQFIAECQSELPQREIPQACGSYAALLERTDVDAVYIPLPTGLRTPWVLRAIEAGKHVLVEKPVGCHAGEVQQILDACERYQVQYMDGVMFMHSQRLPLLRQVLQQPEAVGKIRRIVTQFSFYGGEEFFRHDIRMHSGLEPLGCLGDLGWYCIRFTLWVQQYARPVKVSGCWLSGGKRTDSPAEIPLEFSGEMQFADGVSAAFYCSFVAENQQWAVISGERGFVRIPDFVLPHYGSEVELFLTNASFEQHGCRFHMCDRTRRYAVPEYSDGEPNAQEVRMIRHFSQLVLEGRREKEWGQISLLTQEVMDACLKSSRQDGRWVQMS